MTAPIAKTRVELDEIAAAWATTYVDTSAKIKHLEELKARARAHLEAAIGDAEEATHDGHVVARYTTVESSRVDITKLRENYPDVAAACTLPQTTRRFTVPDGT